MRGRPQKQFNYWILFIFKLKNSFSVIDTTASIFLYPFYK
ncbi:hypothetical protein Y11_06331 [Yersinia enterocolitica subsp. palearctica Y11]|uniref:Uncharacterized protein n=1 Tax=Yersinia enterocolitica subsp. palearctica serotype O:3 (strain DSM 13030 / CIP 106945 / Y11) TaxID=930944 RepID=A0A0H3NQQ4_YERE1|nr:hypothetical protein Y11_06331 [Yersinia enterocolitica subsp. palearctica Y11]